MIDKGNKKLLSRKRSKNKYGLYTAFILLFLVISMVFNPTKVFAVEQPAVVTALLALLNGISGIFALIFTVLSKILLIVVFIVSTVVGLLFTGDATFSVDSLLFNKLPLVGLDFSNVSVGHGKEAVAQMTNMFWYLTMAMQFIILIYVFVKLLASILSPTNNEFEKKGRVKVLLIDWIKGVAILFFMNFIIFAVIWTNNALVSALSKVVGPSYFNAVSGQFLETAVKTWGWTALLGTLAYVYINVQAFALLLYYLKRFVKVAFLIIISPLIAATYAVDKFKDGKAQTFMMWFKELFFNVYIQLIHIFIYVGLYLPYINSLRAEGGTFLLIDYLPNIVIFVFVGTFFFKAEGLLKTLFGLDGVESTANAASMLLQTSIIKKLMSGKPKQPEPDGDFVKSRKFIPRSSKNKKGEGDEKGTGSKTIETKGDKQDKKSKKDKSEKGKDKQKDPDKKQLESTVERINKERKRATIEDIQRQRENFNREQKRQYKLAKGSKKDRAKKRLVKMGKNSTKFMLSLASASAYAALKDTDPGNVVIAERSAYGIVDQGSKRLEQKLTQKRVKKKYTKDGKKTKEYQQMQQEHAQEADKVLGQYEDINDINLDTTTEEGLTNTAGVFAAAQVRLNEGLIEKEEEEVIKQLTKEYQRQYKITEQEAINLANRLKDLILEDRKVLANKMNALEKEYASLLLEEQMGKIKNSYDNLTAKITDISEKEKAKEWTSFLDELPKEQENLAQEGRSIRRQYVKPEDVLGKDKVLDMERLYGEVLLDEKE